MQRTALIAALAGLTAAHTAEEWKKRSVYQLLTDRFAKTDGDTSTCNDLSKYCGGTFKGIENNLDYISGMGFDAIWISPIPTNAEEDYHGYGALDWESVNDHFGSSQDLSDLINAAHAKDIWVMLDVVANHTSYYANSDFSNVMPFDKSEYYHPKCDINWDDQWSVEHCWLSGLPDLDQSNDYVRTYLKNWIRNVVENFDFDGIRIDTIPHIEKPFWKEYGDASGVFQMGECFNGDVDFVSDYQNYVTGLFNYPMFFTIKDVFGSGNSMYDIRNRYDEETGKFPDVTALGSFMDNHDNARWLSFGYSWSSFKSAITFAMTAQGIPFFYYGDEQGFNGGNDPANRESLWDKMDTNAEVYQMVAKINKARKAAQTWDHDYVERYVTDTFFSYSFGDMLVMVTNSENNQDIDMPYLPYEDGTNICNVLGYASDCKVVTGGRINAHVEGGESKIYLPKTSSYFDDVIEQTEFLQM